MDRKTTDHDWARSTYMGWDHIQRIHVLPLNDLREHEEAPECWCRPTQDEEYPEVWVHNALDQRELVESNERRWQ